MRVAGIELGGTKTVVVVGDGGNIDRRVQFPTTTPEETLSNVKDALKEFDAEVPLEAIGIASFGPVRIDPAAPDYGKILATPKAGWTGTDVIGGVQLDHPIPITIDTDVNAAALAEYKMGAAQGCANVVYLTIGTGLGGGLLVDGAPVHGVLHPEIGHIRTRRLSGDTFAGNCPFHGDCIEGLISGPALAKRFGCDPATVSFDDKRWTTVANDLAELCAMLILTYSPHRIIIGGGVALGQRKLLKAAKQKLPILLAGYLSDYDQEQVEEAIVHPSLQHGAGAIGAMLIA